MCRSVVSEVEPYALSGACTVPGGASREGGPDPARNIRGSDDKSATFSPKCEQSAVRDRLGGRDFSGRPSSSFRTATVAGKSLAVVMMKMQDGGTLTFVVDMPPLC